MVTIRGGVCHLAPKIEHEACNSQQRKPLEGHATRIRTNVDTPQRNEEKLLNAEDSNIHNAGGGETPKEK